MTFIGIDLTTRNQTCSYKKKRYIVMRHRIELILLSCTYGTIHLLFATSCVGKIKIKTVNEEESQKELKDVNSSSSKLF